MKFYKHFYSENTDYQDIEIFKPIGFPDFYSVLKGRYYGYCILKSKSVSKTLKNDILKECTTIRVSFFLEEIIPALLIKNEYEFLKLILDTYYEELFESDVWSSTTTSAIYLIGLSNSNWHAKSYSRAKRNLELVQLELVEIGYYDYLSLLYYYTKLKISFSEKAIEINRNALKNIKLHVKKTGFKLFLSLAKEFSLK
jgi:hypothetical protein